MKTKVAAIQMCSSHRIEDNLANTAQLIHEASDHGAELIVLPEMFAIMGLNSNDKVASKETFGKGKIQSFLAEQALKNNTWIVGGTIPIACKDKHKVKAACLLYNSMGGVAARYDKSHLFDVTLSEAETYRETDTASPGHSIVISNTPFGKLGLAVCYDIRFPALFNEFHKQGVEIIAIPAAFTVKTGNAHWELLARARAVECWAYLIGACQGGTHTSGRKTYGHSLIVNPWGSVEAEQQEDGNGIVYATIDLDYLHKLRRSIPTNIQRNETLRIGE